VDEAVAALENGLYADTPEWEAALERARPELDRQSTIADTHGGIAVLAGIAGGRHARVFAPVKWAAYTQMSDPGTAFPLPTDSTAGIDALRSASSDTSCGWVIDLRGNSEGNAYPMLGSVAPLLNDGHVLGFRDRDGGIDWIDVGNGNIIVPADYEIDVSRVDLSFSQPVIVTGPDTASAAETIVVAFAGQQDTVRVGDYTAGLTTGNEVFELNDGAALAPSTSFYVDRTGAVYDGPSPRTTRGVPPRRRFWPPPRLDSRSLLAGPRTPER